MAPSKKSPPDDPPTGPFSETHSAFFEITKDRPRKRGRPSMWEGLMIDDLAVEGSVTVHWTKDLDKEDKLKAVIGLRTYVSRLGKRLGKQFSVTNLSTQCIITRVS